MEWEQSVGGVIYYVARETFFTLNFCYSSIVFLDLQGKLTKLLSLKRGFLLKFPDLNWIPYFYFVIFFEVVTAFFIFFQTFTMICHCSVFLELANNSLIVPKLCFIHLYFISHDIYFSTLDEIVWTVCHRTTVSKVY